MAEGLETSPVVLRFDQSAYDLDSVKRAAYRFSDRFAVEIFVEDRHVACKVFFPRSITPDAQEQTLAEFRKELLDQDLRRSISAETAQIRNAILALAFAPSRLQKDE